MEFSQETMEAITQAAFNKDPIDDLEFIGVPVRTISILSKHGIATMDQLLNKTQQELCDMRSLNTPSVNKLLECLQHYDELAAVRK